MRHTNPMSPLRMILSFCSHLFWTVWINLPICVCRQSIVWVIIIRILIRGYIAFANQVAQHNAYNMFSPQLMILYWYLDFCDDHLSTLYMCICVLLICIFVYIFEDRNQVSTGQRSFVSKAVLMANKGSHHLRNKFFSMEMFH